MNTMIPCKNPKCIAFPVCKNKRQVDCQAMYDYFNEMCSTKKEYPIQFSELWNELKPTFPNLKEISSDLQIIDGSPIRFTFVYEGIPYKKGIWQ